MSTSSIAHDRASQLATLDATGHGREAVAAFALLDRVVRARGLTDHGRLGLAASRNHARAVTDADGTALVLKVTMAPFGDELTALRAWQRPALTAEGHVPGLRAAGRLRSGATWSLQTRLPGTTCWVNERPGLTEHAVGLLLRLDEVVRAEPARRRRALTRLPDGRTLLRLEAESAVRQLARTSAVPTATRRRLTSATVTAARVLRDTDPRRDAVLHADFACNNLVVADSGADVGLIDPAGRRGPLELDAARWVARSLSVDPLDDGLDRVVAAAGGRLDERLVAAALVLQGILLVQWTTYEDHIRRSTEALVADVDRLHRRLVAS